MNSKSTPESILQQIARIQRMDQGTVSVIRQGPHGPYYNHQCYENGRNVSRYLPAEQVPALEEAIEGYRRFQELVKQYVQHVIWLHEGKVLEGPVSEMLSREKMEAILDLEMH